MRLLPVCSATLLVLLLAGCAPGAQAMSRPTPTSTPVFSPLAPPSVAPAAAEATGTPIPPPTPTSPAAALTALPYPQHFSLGGATATVTPVPAAPQVVCTDAGDTIACYDELLALEFRYPAFLGPLRYSSLRQGGYSGYAYEYEFADPEVDAGGRSSDHSEGRGLMYTDQWGFGARTAAEICAQWEAAFCVEPRPGAVLIGMLPKAERLCTDAMPYPDIPRGILALDLPLHPLLQGFAFSFPLLNAADAAEFRDDWYSDEIKCTPENKAALAAYVEQLARDLPAGAGPVEMQARYDALVALAASVQGKYFGASD